MKLLGNEAHAERAFLAAMDGGCQVPIAGYATTMVIQLH